MFILLDKQIITIYAQKVYLNILFQVTDSGLVSMIGQQKDNGNGWIPIPQPPIKTGPRMNLMPIVCMTTVWPWLKLLIKAIG